MSIRESIVQQPEKEMRLHEFTLETDKKTELVFDPETEISDEDWKGMKQDLEARRQEASGLNFYRQATNMKILFPKKAKELGLDEKTWQKMKELGEHEKSAPMTPIGNFSQLAMKMKILYPEKAAELGLDERAWQRMEQDLKNWRRDRVWGAVCERAMEMKILCPEKVAELGLDKEVWQGMKMKLDDLRQTRDWWVFPQEAMLMKILWPEKVAERGLDDEAWKEMKQQLEISRREGRWWDFSHQAMAMKILAAKEVKITDRGIECVMPSRESFQEKIAPRPVRREF